MGRLRGQRMAVLGEKVAELQELNYYRCAVFADPRRRMPLTDIEHSPRRSTSPASSTLPNSTTPRVYPVDVVSVIVLVASFQHIGLKEHIKPADTCIQQYENLVTRSGWSCLMRP